MFVTSASSGAQALPAQPRPPRRMLASPALAMALVMAGCASAPTHDPHDPFESYNRGMDAVNRGLDHAVLRPAARAYQKAVPDPVRTVVSNAFGNLSDIWSAANSALQLKLRNAGENASRFAINTVLGFGGMFDIAERMNLERHKEDFGTTLGRWGVPSGPYVVLPLLGPSSVRDALALPIDFFGNPLRWVSPPMDRNALGLGRAVDIRAKLLAVDPVVDSALDPYLVLRDAYLQRRQSQAGRKEDATVRSPDSTGAADASHKSDVPTDTEHTPSPPAAPNGAG